jgi:hypothetical protein
MVIEMIIETKKILPEISHTGSKVEIKEGKEKIVVFWKNKHRHPTPIEIPVSLQFTEELISLMGFWLGDGLKSSKGGSSRTVAFTNSEPQIVNWVMRIFEIFNIEKEKLSASVTLRATSEVNIEEVKEFWSKITGIPKDKISVNVRKSLRKNLRNLPQPKKFGSIKIEFHSAVLRDVIISLLEFCKKIALTKKEFAVSFLKGLLAADGSAVSDGRTKRVVICCMSEVNKKFIKQLLNVCQINSKERKDGVEIRGEAELLKLKELNIFELHPERNRRFLNFFSF